MSLITRCPACGTLFRVVPDQLKISDGWVRCGQCNEIFDAQAALQISPPAVADAEPLHEEAFAATQFSPEAWPGEGPDAPEATVAVEPVDEPDLQWTIPMEPPGAELSTGVVEPEPEPEPEPEARSEPEPHDPPGRAPASFDAGDGHSPVEPFADTVVVLEEPGPIEPTLRDEPLAVSPPPLEDAPAASSDVVSPDTPAIPPAADPLEAAPEATPPVPLDRVSFVRQARRRAFWRRPVVRVLLLLVALLLGLALVIQVAIQERDRLALQVPALRPALELLCKPLQCQVGPPRRIEAIVIDSSAFSRLRPDAYRLAVTLSNRSALPVALPALELTLTDTQDQPVLRRVLRAPELGQAADGAAGGAIAANAEWSATLTITITPDANAARIAGYRLLAFYP